MIEKEPHRKSVIVFYDTDAASAKQRVQELKRRGRVDASFDARLYHVSAWSGEPERCEGVVLMPDVQGWQRGRLEAAFNGRILEDTPRLVGEIIEGAPLAALAPLAHAVMTPPEGDGTGGQPSGDGGAATEEPPKVGEPKRVLTLRQGARNKWYVDDIDKVPQAGPFDTKAQAEAERALMLAE